MSMQSSVGFRRNKWTFGLGTLGRDMTYTMVAMFLIYFLTEVADLSDQVLWWTSTIMLVTRLFDAFTDLLMGQIVDNTVTRWGSYKPWIGVGALSSAICTVLLFADSGNGWAFVVLFSLTYFVWSLAWTMNDIPYWALLPALSQEQSEREQAGAIAKTVASIGTFSVVIAILPATSALGNWLGDARVGWIVFATIVVVIMLVFQAITLFGVREPRLQRQREKSNWRGLWQALWRNDQLLWVALAMVLFQIGFITTTSFGTYFFKYAFRDEEMYSVFALVIAVAQLSGFAVFPLMARRYSRRQLYRFATVLILIGYLVFFFAPMNIWILALAGLPLFFGDAFVVMLMLMFLADTVEYGHWKLGRRSAALTFSLQPFINKVAAALATQVVAVTVILSGINAAKTPADVSASGLWLMKAMMLIFPLVLIGIGYLLVRAKYRIDAEKYQLIIAELKQRGDLD